MQSLIPIKPVINISKKKRRAGKTILFKAKRQHTPFPLARFFMKKFSGKNDIKYIGILILYEKIRLKYITILFLYEKILPDTLEKVYTKRIHYELTNLFLEG
jgi:hypothetical protein